MTTRRIALFFLLPFLLTIRTYTQEISAPPPQSAVVTGTIEDTNNDVIPGATVLADDSIATERRTATANDNGAFLLPDLRPGVAYRITVHAEGFKDWSSPAIDLTPGQYLELTQIKLPLAAVETTVTAVMPEQVAIEQVHAEEQQRVLGIIPNFYVVYDKDAVPLTSKLKYQMALKAGTDAVSIASVALLSGMNQAGDTPDYGQGWKSYGQRFGAAYAGSFSDIMIGGAVLPSLLHQDPRYFYQGTGTTRSRTIHALSAPFVARGDNGHLQFNASSIGGDLATGALSNLYYPASNRGANLVFTGALITTGGRIANALAQEFVLHRLTSRAKSEY
jgi:hypothetical protein